MPSKEEWFTWYDITIFLHLNNHIHSQPNVAGIKGKISMKMMGPLQQIKSLLSHHLQPPFLCFCHSFSYFCWRVIHTDLCFLTLEILPNVQDSIFLWTVDEITVLNQHFIKKQNVISKHNNPITLLCFNGVQHIAQQQQCQQFQSQNIHMRWLAGPLPCSQWDWSTS